MAVSRDIEMTENRGMPHAAKQWIVFSSQSLTLDHSHPAWNRNIQTNVSLHWNVVPYVGFMTFGRSEASEAYALPPPSSTLP